jgi:hypothetical protein
MNRDLVMRRALWISVGFNLFGAALFAFPESPPGRLIGLPGPVPPIYGAVIAFFVLLFGGAYAWLAMRPVIDRPLVGFAAIGKAGFFVLVTIFWLAGHAPALGVGAAVGDLVFAAIFAWWLRSPAPSRVPRAG